MRTRNDEKGSALIIAVVVVLILAAMAVALLTETVFRTQATNESNENDEATMICRAGIERARRALYLYRANRTWDPSLAILTGSVAGDYIEQWNNILVFNQSTNTDCLSTNPDDKRYFPLATTPLQDVLQGVRDNFAFVRDNSEFDAYGNSPTVWRPEQWHADDAGLLPEDPAGTQNAVVFGACKPFRSGAYHIYLRDNDDGDGDPLVDADRTVICTVTAILPDGTMRQMEGALFYTPAQYIGGGFDSGGDVSISGSVTVNGDGNIFANGNLSFSGGASVVTGTSQAAGSVSGTPGTGTAPVGGQTPIQIPEIDPVDLADDDPANTYHFSPAGIITGPGGFSWNYGTQGAWYGFKFQSGSWSISGSTSPPGPPVLPDGTPNVGGTGTVHGGNGYIFHFQTDFSMTGAGNGNAMIATFLVEGNANMGGNRQIIPFYSNVSIMARRDLDINGTSGNANFPGFYAAHEQIRLQGGGGANAPKLYGALLAEDAENISTFVNGVTGSDLSAGGNITVTTSQIPTPIQLDSNVSIRNLLRTYPK